MTMAQDHDESAQPRKRLVLKPRDPQAAEALEKQRLERIKSNPFGDAKPREAVIAQREGKDEKDIVKAASEEYQVKLRLSGDQIAEKRAAEEGIKALQRQLDEEEDEAKRAELQAELAQREADIAEMIAKFEQIIVEQAKKGTAPRLSERRAAAETRDAQQGAGSGFLGHAGGYQDRRGGERGGGAFGRPGGFQDREGGFQGRSGGYNAVNDGGFGDGFGNPTRGGRRYEEQGGNKGTYETFAGGNARGGRGGGFGSGGFSDYKERGGGGGGGFAGFQDARGGRGGSGDRDAARSGPHAGAPRGGKEGGSYGGFGGDRRGGFADYQDRGNDFGAAAPRGNPADYPMGASDVDYQSPYRSGGEF